MRHIFVENEDGVLACEACGCIYGEEKNQKCVVKKYTGIIDLDDEFRGCPKDD